MQVQQRGVRAPAALAADLVAVLTFTTLGRRNHDEGLSAAGIATTAWPFLVGALVGWALSRGWRRPGAIVPTGVTVWVCTIAVGMLLRKATGAGTALSFVLVAGLVTGLSLLGWRAVVAALARHRA